ncbi:MAG: ABC transporter permease [Egibacteraceae bacterium]
MTGQANLRDPEAPVATATAPPTQATSIAFTSRLRWAIADGLAVTGRNLRHWVRQPQLLVFSTIQPVMFVLLFTYVFGSAIQVPGGSYVNFLMPGILVHAVAFGATQTAIGLAVDLAGGMIDRFRSLPMARSAVLVGRTCADLVRNLFVVLLMIAVGYLVGFRFTGGWVEAIGAVLMVVGLGYALSWVYCFIGLSVPNAESAQAASFVVIFPLVFASSAFVPLERMPSWLRAFARATPITHVVNAARVLASGGPVTRPLLSALAWILGLLAVFIPLAVTRFRRAV